MKTCTKCGIEKEESEFGFLTKSKDGLNFMCKKCNVEAQRKWYLLNREKYNEYQRTVSKTNIKKKERNKKYRENNREAEKERAKKWASKNPDKIAYATIKIELKKQIGETPPPELVEVKLLINKTKRLCKTLKSCETH